MRVLVTIPHYFEAGSPGDGRAHGSTARDPAKRVAALTACISALHQLFDPNQRMIVIADRSTQVANEHIAHRTDVVVCTTRGRHVLDQVALPHVAYEHRATGCEPVLLGFECHAVLRERLGSYDYYCYMEDDLIVRDPWFFIKLGWFTSQVGDDVLLQPNRYESAPHGLVLKAYIDGDLRPDFLRPFERGGSRDVVLSDILGVRVHFRRAANPHSGCFFLNARQMAAWAARPDFLDRDTRFVGPLESAATLGILSAFRIYKAAHENAAFFEIEHHGTAFISQIRRRE